MFRVSRHLIRSAALRRPLLLSVMVAGVLQGTSGGHMLLVKHTRCAEHGELVHNEGSHVHQTGERTSTRRTASLGAVRDTGGAAHEHCTLLGDRQDALAAPCGSQVCRLVDAGWQPPAFDDTWSTTGPQLFRLAPKHSPPA